MDDELPMSVRSELAEARVVADRCRRLEAELRDRERDLDECRDELIAALEIASVNEDALKRLKRDLDAAREQVTTLRAKLAESQKLVPLPGTVRKHPYCDCAKLPRRHDYDSRSCTGEADE